MISAAVMTEALRVKSSLTSPCLDKKITSSSNDLSVSTFWSMKSEFQVRNASYRVKK